jgi:hypothetical protein
MPRTGAGPTRNRQEWAVKDKAFDLIRDLPIRAETRRRIV